MTILPSGLPFRGTLRTRLTLIRMTLIRKPWACGVRGSRPHCRYSCLHLLFRTLQATSRLPFNAVRNAPLPVLSAPRGCGCGLMPVHHPRGPARPVSCYALFERIAASKLTSWLSLRAHLVQTTRAAIGGLGRRSGLFPSRRRTLAPADSLPDNVPRHSEFVRN